MKIVTIYKDSPIFTNKYIFVDKLRKFVWQQQQKVILVDVD